MSDYRGLIYRNYYSTQVNKSDTDYAQLLDQQAYYYAKELIPFLPETRSAQILDIGCGFGSFIRAAEKEGYTQISGIDLSSEQVKIGHSLGIKNIIEQSADAWFDQGLSVECIVGIDIIEHFTKSELTGFLLKCRESLAADGTVLFRTPNMDAALSSVYAHADYSHEVFLNKSSALQILRSCGFRDVQVFPSLILNRNPVKEALRKILWSACIAQYKIQLFASGRTWNEVVFSPNLIIKAKSD